MPIFAATHEVNSGVLGDICKRRVRISVLTPTVLYHSPWIQSGLRGRRLFPSPRLPLGTGVPALIQFYVLCYLISWSKVVSARPIDRGNPNCHSQWGFPAGSVQRISRAVELVRPTPGQRQCHKGCFGPRIDERSGRTGAGVDPHESQEEAGKGSVPRRIFSTSGSRSKDRPPGVEEIKLLFI